MARRTTRVQVLWENGEQEGFICGIRRQVGGLGRRDLVSDALGGDLSLELGKRQQDVQRQTSHRRGCVELLRHRYERDLVLIKEFDKLGKVGQRTSQAIDLIDHDDIDLAGADVLDAKPCSALAGRWGAEQRRGCRKYPQARR